MRSERDMVIATMSGAGRDFATWIKSIACGVQLRIEEIGVNLENVGVALQMRERGSPCNVNSTNSFAFSTGTRRKETIHEAWIIRCDNAFGGLREPAPTRTQGQQQCKHS